MRLKQIKLHGFKSFGEPTTIDFIDGVTAIVGPNGCGKSNVSDAFRWVLGEQSARSMRGQRMPDVIFSGTTNRKPMNYAEVSLTFTDVQGALPVDYEEVTVTRRLHRSGESEYFINKHPVRLREVQSLFMDSGVGKAAFSIFEQGKIDQVISLSPEERRYLFEEAAGIQRFLQRKTESLRKLEQTQQNLDRAEDIHHEIERQIAVLEKQAEDAKIYREKKESLESIEKGLIAARWKLSFQRIAQLEEAERAAQAQLDALQTQMADGEASLKVSQEVLAQTTQKLASHREETLRLQGSKDVATKARQYCRERLQEAGHNEQRWQREIEDMKLKATTRQNDAVVCEKTQAELEASREQTAKKLEAQRQSVQVLEEQVTQLRQRQQQGHQERLKRVQEEGRLNSQLTSTRIRLEEFQNRHKSMEERQQTLRDQLGSLRETQKQKQEQQQQVAQEVDAAKARCAAAVAALQQLSKDLEKAEKTLAGYQQQSAELLARQSLLSKMRDDMEGFSIGSKRLLQASSKAGTPIHGLLQPLYPLIVPQAGYEVAVAAMLRPYAQALVVETVQHLETVLAYALQENLTDYTFVCLELISRRTPMTPSEQPLTDCVAQSDVARLLLSGISVQNDKNALVSLAQKLQFGAVCSQDGLVCDFRGVLSGPIRQGNDLFLREAELKSTSQKLTEAQKLRQEGEQQIKALKDERQRLQKEREGADDTLRRIEMRIVETTYAAKRAQDDVDKAQRETDRIVAEISGVSKEVEKLAANLQIHQEAFNKWQNETAASVDQLSEIDSQLERFLINLAEEKGNLRRDEANHSRLVDEQRKLTHTLSLLAVKEHEGQLQENRLDSEIRSGRDLQDRLRKEEAEQEKAIKDLEEKLALFHSQSKQIETELTTCKKTVADAEMAIENERLQQRQSEKEQHQVGLQLAQQRSTIETLSVEMNERYQIQLTPEYEPNPPLSLSINQAERELRSLRQAIEGLANVNMTSIEECDAQKERHAFLTTQIADLLAAKKELLDIIQQLDGESRTMFKQTFETIRANFQKNFKILFEGGEADLVLTESNDLLEAGVDIVARPPGKQMRSIQLMSGGEKCLTAMALLFAIFEVKPAPFCILDEIDAPLDDSNVDRFVRVLKHFADRCQFIIITHNKQTMSIGDVLVGVSMEERGISKVLSVTLSEYEAAN